MREDSHPPAPRMPGWKAAIVYAIAATTDFLKFLFATFIFTAPFMTGIAVSLYTSSHSWPSWASWLASVAAGATEGLIEIAAAPLTAALETFGILMAMLIGLMGWLVLILIFLLSRINPFSARSLLKFLMGFGGSEVPLLDLFPTVTPAVFFLIHDARKEDRQRRAEWEKARAEQEEAEIREVQARAGALRAAREAAREAETIPEEGAEAA